MDEQITGKDPKFNILGQITGLLLSFVLLVVGLVLCFVFNPATVQSESLAIPLEGNRQLVARLFIPKATAAPQPVMVLCHGINASKEVMTPLAVELARHGIAGLAFDFGGSGESYRLSGGKGAIQNLEESNLADAQAVLTYLRANPDRFDVKRMGIAGHSLGGTIALQLAQTDRQLRSTIVMGMSGEAAPSVPKNLFLGVGVYEQLNPVADVRRMYQAATAGKNQAGEIVGDFNTGTARMMVISPTADHVIEPYDSFLIGQAVNWAQRSLNVSVARLPAVFPGYILGLLVAFTGAVATGVLMFVRTGKPVEYPAARQLFRRFVAFTLVALMGVVWRLGSSGLGPSRAASNSLILCYVLLLVTNYALLYSEKWKPALRVAGLYSLVFLEPFMLPALLSGSSEVVKNPGYLIDLPQFLLQWPVFFIYNYTTVFKLALLPTYTLKLQLSWLFLLLILVEFVWPAITLTTLERAVKWAVRQLRRPFRVAGYGSISRRSAGLLGVLVLLLVLIVHQRLQDGVFSLAAGSGLLVLQLISQMVLLPVAVIVVILRSAWFRRLESRCLER
ncbi:alpha/beta hydrolase [Microcoleus sp. FACHB-672]|uniref:alpha/beta hydrolase n=1 Tax=Microcoleus sp. FACHB-672 TaxID=2692825 RepID=UPI0016841829|nr:alpha/beta fold hydrolase [Microcoleus sp. FACHB-672]MBD2040878.1 alpha/beta fold hydrolase [Microcoleus sp. FACHB-672]